MTSTEDVSSARSDVRCLFDDYGDYIYRIISFRMKNSSVCDDVFQELFLYLLKNPIQEPVHNMKSFLYRLVLRFATNYYHKEKRYEEIKYDAARNNTAPDSEGRPVDRLVYNEELSQLFNYIEKNLAQREAKVILSRHRDHLNVEETSRIHGVDKRTVSHYYSKGMRRLKELFQARKP